jgi:menaquinone-dependent protoporphyrinogen oxidase
MMNIALLYASHDGQTRRIADYLAFRMEAEGADVYPCDLGKNVYDRYNRPDPEVVVLLAPVRYGFHLKPVDGFIRQHKAFLKQRRFVLVSVNLTARKPDKDLPETNPYLMKWIKRHGLNPDRVAVFAGKLDYARYRWWEKLAIRLIMWMTGGPTDLTACVDYTQWEKVKALATQISEERKGQKRAVA